MKYIAKLRLATVVRESPRLNDWEMDKYKSFPSWHEAQKFAAKIELNFPWLVVDVEEYIDKDTHDEDYLIYLQDSYAQDILDDIKEEEIDCFSECYNER